MARCKIGVWFAGSCPFWAQNWKIPSGEGRERGFPSGLTQRSAMKSIPMPKSRQHNPSRDRKTNHSLLTHSPDPAAASLAGLSRRGDAEPSSSQSEGATGAPRPSARARRQSRPSPWPTAAGNDASAAGAGDDASAAAGRYCPATGMRRLPGVPGGRRRAAVLQGARLRRVREEVVAIVTCPFYGRGLEKSSPPSFSRGIRSSFVDFCVFRGDDSRS